MEIADVFVINKSDQPGAERMEHEIQGMLSLGHDATPIVRTVATTGAGIPELLKIAGAPKRPAGLAQAHFKGGHTSHTQIGIIGGSGLYAMPGFEAQEEVVIETPFGPPSDNLIVGKLAGHNVAFLARHGRGHRISPSELNFRANIYAMKSLGVERIISLSAVGSLKEEHKPLDFVIPDQFVDRTRGRISTFFGEGLVAHIGFADPICPQLADIVAEACAEAGVSGRKGGSYLCMEGPAFSTRAESNLYRSWGMDVIGMTNLQEAKLAREAEICYVTVAMVTDYDCWHPDHDAVTVTDIIGNLVKNAENACKVVASAVARMPAGRNCKCGSALAHAMLTDPKIVPETTRRKLDIIVGKYFV
jgi:5'-methylthioadenosine phosphorylase